MSSPLSAFRDAVGYTQLADELGAELPDAAGFSMAQIEASTSQTTLIYAPNSNLAVFVGKTFTDESSGSEGTSGHADTVARNLYGTVDSLAPGADDIHIYYAGEFVGTGYLAPVTFGLGGIRTSEPETALSPVQNHSWIGTQSDPSDAEDTLERFDFAINRDGFLAAVGVNNGSQSAVPQLMASSWNALSVGRTDGNHSSGTTTVAGTGRTKPEIVAPSNATSFATPIVGGAALLLVDAASRNPGWEAEPGNATLPETLRAILTAGATKAEFADWDRTAERPFDETFGAGELNIHNSYRLLEAGEVPVFDAENPSTAPGTAWNVADIVAGATDRYVIAVPPGRYLTNLSIVATWNRIVIKEGGGNAYTGATTEVANLSMVLATAATFSPVETLDSSDSAVDNYEHIYLPTALGPGQYLVEVNSAAGDPASTRYAIAWRGDEAPVNFGIYASLYLAEASEAERGPDSDPDGDGATNAEEYATNSDPLDPGSIPILDVTTRDDFGDGEVYAVLSFERPIDATDLTTEPVAASVPLGDDASTEDFTLLATVPVGDDLHERVSYRYDVPLVTGSNGVFFSLDVTVE